MAGESNLELRELGIPDTEKGGATYARGRCHAG